MKPPELAATTAYTGERDALLSPSASGSSEAVRRYNQKCPDIRTPYSRDGDRIINSRAYARYIDKTQVFSLVRNDHITHRVLHVQLVSKIARTIGRSLRLNEDLIEAISLGHDIGHIPFGHTGESIFSKICEKHGVGPFRHNVQSVHFLQTVENLDLTLQVLDGILCHNGESDDTTLEPSSCEGWDEFDSRFQAVRSGSADPHPMTMEGCVVRFTDTIAYIGRDIQDAREVGLIGENENLPEEVSEVLGNDNRSIVDTLIRDLITHSGNGVLSYSPEVAAALATLKKFNYREIYDNPRLTSQRPKIKNMYETVFSGSLRDLQSENPGARIFRDYIDASWVSQSYLKSARSEEIVSDFVSGMTDNYFESCFSEMVMPTRVYDRFDSEDPR